MTCMRYSMQSIVISADLAVLVDVHARREALNDATVHVAEDLALLRDVAQAV